MPYTQAQPATQAPMHGAIGSASLSSRLAGFVSSTDASHLPRRAIELAKDRILDAIATAIAGRDLPVPRIARAFAGSGTGACTVIGAPARVQAIDAAFINATLINACTHDDFIAKSHAGAVVVPAALAIGEEENATGKAVLTAVVLGYELVARAYMGGPAMLPRFRATGVAGTFGAAAAAAKLMRLDQEQTRNAIGLSAMFASGFGEGFRTGAMDVKLNVGWASRSGVSAAQLARAGATSAPLVLEGPSGFYLAVSDSAEHALDTVTGLGERFLIEDTVYKERPICVFVQTPVELARRLSVQHELADKPIERVQISAPLATLTNPGYQNVAPFSTPLQARISARFTVAAALLGRPVDTYKYFDHLDDSQVLDLCGRIDLIEPTDDSHVYLQVHSGGAVFRLAGKEMDHLLASREKIVAKFERLTAGIDPSTRRELMQSVLELDQLGSVHALTRHLRAA